jgi:hypothetical protein
MPLLDTISKMTTARGRARLALQRATFFAIGRIGADACVSRAERALVLILREPDAASILLELLQRAPLPGQLYALLGLRECRYEGVERLFEAWRGRTGEVSTQTGCLRGLQPVRSVVARIEDGTYSCLLKSHEAR